MSHPARSRHFHMSAVPSTEDAARDHGWRGYGPGGNGGGDAAAQLPCPAAEQGPFFFAKMAAFRNSRGPTPRSDAGDRGAHEPEVKNEVR